MSGREIQEEECRSREEVYKVDDASELVKSATTKFNPSNVGDNPESGITFLLFDVYVDKDEHIRRVVEVDKKDNTVHLYNEVIRR